MFTQRLNLTFQDARTVSATKLHELGSICETPDGRVYRYSQAGAVDLAAGKLNNTVAKVANHTNNAVAAAAAVGARSVSVTLAGATATTAGQYDDGFLVVNDTVGAGSAYRIAGTPVIAASGTGSIFLEEGIATALTTSSKVSLVPNPFAGSIVTAAAAALFCNGTNNVAVTAANYYWSQTGGIASVLSDGIITKAAGALVSASVNGAATIELAATVTQRIGVAPEATVDAKYYPLFLTIGS
jgi:hypothetical protein